MDKLIITGFSLGMAMLIASLVTQEPASSIFEQLVKLFWAFPAGAAAGLAIAKQEFLK